MSCMNNFFKADLLDISWYGLVSLLPNFLQRGTETELQKISVGWVLSLFFLSSE